MDLNGKVALVTGAAQGIGLATVKELLKNGVKGVSICDSDSNKGKDAVAMIAKEFGEDRVIFIRTDVTKQKDLEEAFKKTKDTFNTVDIVFNNAGIIDDEHWEREIDINVGGVIRGTQLALRYMGKDNGGKGGTIINTASVSGLGLKSASPIYDGTKFFIVGYCMSMAFPLMDASHGVRILCICPGLTDTSIGTGVVNGYEKLNVEKAKFLAQCAMQQPENVAEGIIHMLREAGTGTIWVSDRCNPIYQITYPELVKF